MGALPRLSAWRAEYSARCPAWHQRQRRTPAAAAGYESQSWHVADRLFQRCQKSEMAARERSRNIFSSRSRESEDDGNSPVSSSSSLVNEDSESLCGHDARRWSAGCWRGPSGHRRAIAVRCAGSSDWHKTCRRRGATGVLLPARTLLRWRVWTRSREREAEAQL